MKLGTVAYVPPPGICSSEAFMANITRFSAKYPLYIFSDSSINNPSRVIKSPEMVGRKPAWALNNLCWFRGLEMARDAGLDYFCYLEVDSRVGCKWFDDVVFTEYFERYPNGIACAGHPVAWDTSSGGREFAMRIVAEAFAFQEATGVPVSFYSSRDPRDCSGGAYYCNGSGAIYETKALLNIFSGFDISIEDYSRRLTAWDLAIGKFLWNYHGPRAVEHIGWLSRTISCFGDCILKADERKALLLSGKCSIIHQVKDDWVP